MKEKALMRIGVLWLPLIAGGCSPASMVDSVSSHMPVIGERCENWQCFTASGRAESEARKQQQQPPQQKGNTMPAAATAANAQGVAVPAKAPPPPPDPETDPYDTYHP